MKLKEYIAEARDYYGNRGVGVIIACGDEILLMKRSDEVYEPGTWSYPGGRVEDDEDKKSAAVREAMEETGYTIGGRMNLLHIFNDSESGFQYTTFIVHVNNKPSISLNWENDNYGWFNTNNLPRPLHFGLRAALPRLKNHMKAATRQPL